MTLHNIADGMTNQTVRCRDPEGLNFSIQNCEKHCQLFDTQFVKNT